MRVARSGGHVQWLATVFQFAFFLGAIVILMNLLIAMMADTYTSVVANAEAECTPRHRSFFVTCLGLTQGNVIGGVACRPNAVRQAREGGLRDHGVSRTT